MILGPGTALALLGVLVVLASLGAYLLFKGYYSTYPKLKKILEQIRGNDTHFMNFGLWRDNPGSISEANTALCEFLVKKGGLSRSRKILDVGCGFGEQDLVWHECNDDKAGLSIQGLDIEKFHVQESRELIERHGLSDKIKFSTGDACDLAYGDESFDTVISLESAFHYQPRSAFFEEAARVLQPGGKLVIGDIVLRHDCGVVGRCASYLAADSMNAPPCNSQDLGEWVAQIERAGFKVEHERITDDTFVPYFDHIVHQFDHDDFIIRWAYHISVSAWAAVCRRSLPFDYVVAVCTKV